MSGEATKKQPEQQDPQHSNDPKRGNSEHKDGKTPAHQGGQQGQQGEQRDQKSGQPGDRREQGHQQDSQHQKSNPSRPHEQSHDKSQREKH
jgi:hypothetical protein